MNKNDVLTVTRQPGSPMRWTIESTDFAHGAPIEDCDYALRYEMERAARKAGSQIIYRDAREFRKVA